ncbi:MAG: hypothetical protein NTV43_06395 [Methylococcales bacterium]|nr:hypothetical protein [Methylococcales bacterium]
MIDLQKDHPNLNQPDALADDDVLLERQALAAEGQKMVIYSIVCNFLLGAVERSIAMPGLALELLLIAVALYSLVGMVKICSGLNKTQNQKILFMVLAFLPLINLLAIVYLSVKTTRFLRDGGWEVGLFGAKL